MSGDNKSEIHLTSRDHDAMSSYRRAPPKRDFEVIDDRVSFFYRQYSQVESIMHDTKRRTDKFKQRLLTQQQNHRQDIISQAVQHLEVKLEHAQQIQKLSRARYKERVDTGGVQNWLDAKSKMELAELLVDEYHRSIDPCGFQQRAVAKELSDVLVSDLARRQQVSCRRRIEWVGGYLSGFKSHHPPEDEEKAEMLALFEDLDGDQFGSVGDDLPPE
eukprot:gnl/Dysnectes_brevis/6876_a11004_227.p1 GENE.gnl/Dysnectes_brevis/6876_a11004_227~~gnl/Dysnectes_brevis/6876_a11004_227.p1  ORF type:complete len:217 (+),score=74.90 gnl/Dysnectes_brevis/6876_a11004_227:658-1308(+)